MDASSPGDDLWSAWLLHRRHADDPQYERAIEQATERYANRVLDQARLHAGMTLLIGFRATFWQDIDAEALSTVAAQGLKYALGRARPLQGDNANVWFHSGEQSFPSGEVALQAAFVTPLTVDYMKQDPRIAALEVLPLYDAIARMKVHGHWQSDVIGGWLVGTGVGYWSSTFKVPLMVRILPRGLTIGVSTHF